MQLFLFAMIYPLLWLVSILPMRLLYVLSDIIFIFAYYLVGYRKKVVRHNLHLSFPDKTKAELKQIEKRSIQHFVDQFMELIKSFTISEKELDKRVCLTNPELPDAYYDDQKSIILLTGHYANWEWVTCAVNKSLRHELSVVYKKLKNKYLDRLIRRSRNKFGVKVVPTKEFYPEILTNLKNKKIGVYGFLADQSPKKELIKYWGNFMGIEIPVVIGPETIAKKLNMPVFYFKTVRLKRGYYQSTFVLLEENPKQAEPYEITNKYMNELEKQIRKDPEYYFWTHKRFKHLGKKDDFAPKRPV